MPNWDKESFGGKLKDMKNSQIWVGKQSQKKSHRKYHIFLYFIIRTLLAIIISISINIFLFGLKLYIPFNKFQSCQGRVKDGLGIYTGV